MLRILLAGRGMADLASLAAGLKEDRRAELTFVDSAAAAFDSVGRGQIDLAIVGEELVDASPVECITQMVRCNPMINCAMISGMDHDAFHEATEGLGILMQLPPAPSQEDATALLAKVDSIAMQLSGLAGKGGVK